jgi:uncharacterized membrane protein
MLHLRYGVVVLVSAFLPFFVGGVVAVGRVVLRVVAGYPQFLLFELVQKLRLMLEFL